MPSGKLAEAINRDFGSFDALKSNLRNGGRAVQFRMDVADRIDNNGKLSIVSESNHEQSAAQGAASAADRRRVGTRLLHRLPQRAARFEKFLGTGRLEHRRKTIRKINPPRAGRSPKRPDAMSHPAFLLDLPPGVSPPTRASGCTSRKYAPATPPLNFSFQIPHIAACGVLKYPQTEFRDNRQHMVDASACTFRKPSTRSLSKRNRGSTATPSRFAATGAPSASSPG